jgi:hypothetical protein
MMKEFKLVLVCCAMLCGCATLDGGPKAMAENTCRFAFLATVPIAGTLLGAGLCSYGVEELKEKEPRRELDPG